MTNVLQMPVASSKEVGCLVNMFLILSHNGQFEASEEGAALFIDPYCDEYVAKGQHAYAKVFRAAVMQEVRAVLKRMSA